MPPARTLRLLTLVVLASLVMAACGDAASEAARGDAAPAEDAPGASALDDLDHPSFPEPLVDTDRIISGGPPPDGIPPIDDPRYLTAADVDFLADAEPVLALEIDRDARAYPVQIMIWHEIVNDIVGGVPVTISYCPLCNSALVYDRRVDDRVLDFGTSGLLYNSALVMFDRQTESLWSHFSSQAIVGQLTGTELTRIPVSTVSWASWREANPDGLVLSRDTGASRDYGTNPYPGYDDVNSSPFLFDGELDGRLRAKERVIGIDAADDAVAVQLATVADDGPTVVTLDGRRLVVWVEEGTASALDATSIADGADVGATGVFVASHEGEPLDFELAEAGFVDDQTGSAWNVLGEAVAGPLAGVALEPVVHVDTFWFAWAAFQPETRIA